MITLAAIDVGSNAMRLAIGRFTDRGQWELIATKREAVRLGQDVFRNGRLSQSVIEQAVAAFARFKRTIVTHKASRVWAVGTSALRDASNNEVLIDRVRRATGIQLTPISGDEEARLVHLAVARTVDLKRGAALLIDIGGGSVEISLVDRGTVILSDSVQMGTVRLMEMLRGRTRQRELIERLVRDYAGGVKRRVSRRLGGRPISRAIGTGGNIEALGDLRVSLLGKTSKETIERGELQKLTDTLAGMTYRQRIEDLGLRPDRADVILPASALVNAIIQQSGIRRLLVPRVGLREGMLIDMFESQGDVDPMPLERCSRQVIDAALELGRRFSFEEAHSLHVAKLALQLFDQTRSLHGLSREGRVLLEVAATLHDVGHILDSESHHKHSSYIISKSRLTGLTPRQSLIAGIIARYHHGTHPSNERGDWRGLTPNEKKMVLPLTGMLRFAEQLDMEHLARVSAVKVRRRADVVTVTLVGRGKLLVERWAAEQEKSLLEKALKVSIKLT